MKKEETKYWYLVPHLIIDREKYRGKGRPRKEDYRMMSIEKDFTIMKHPYQVTFKQGEGKYIGITMSTGE